MGVQKKTRRVCDNAEIEYLSPHAMRHGFATGLLHKGIDPVTIARLGGWKSPAHVFATYGHARKEDQITDVLSESEVVAFKRAENDHES